MPAAPDGGAGARALVDARGLLASGIGRYLREILAVLLRDQRFSRIALLGVPGELRDFCAGRVAPERMEIHGYPFEFYQPAAQLAWLRLRAARAVEADVAFFPHYDAPLLALPRRSVVTVHDLIHFKVPEAFAPGRRAAAGVLLRRAVSQAARVITVSEATRSDLVERFPWAAAKTGVIPNGVSSVFRALAEAEPVPERIAALRPFLLCVGNRKPHKNLAAAVEVLALLRPERPELRLVLVGRAFPEGDAVRRRAEALGVVDALVELDAVDDGELRRLYGQCEALLFPSMYEGFGLPVVEAMACGAPVIASNRSSLPEVVGDAGLTFAPDDFAGMAGAVRRLRREPELREALACRGRERARGLSWESTARRTVDALHRVATDAS